MFVNHFELYVSYMQIVLFILALSPGLISSCMQHSVSICHVLCAQFSDNSNFEYNLQQHTCTKSRATL